MHTCLAPFLQSTPLAGQQSVASPLTHKEISNAIKSSKNNKAPGPDGITSELWKHLHAKYTAQKDSETPAFDIARLLELLIQDIQLFGVQPQLGFDDAWMCPIFKKGDVAKIENYRPISVLNSDYKLMTSVFSQRLSTIAPRLIHPNQAGFIKGRLITDHTQLLQLLVPLAEKLSLNGMIVALDQEKAYDRIKHDYLWETLRSFHFQPEFITMLQSLRTRSNLCHDKQAYERILLCPTRRAPR